MNFGLFEPLFGKQIPKKHNFSSKESEPSPVNSIPSQPSKISNVSRAHKNILQPPLTNNQLGQLLGELDQSKIIIIVLAIAIAIMFVFYFYLNTRQKSQKQLIYKMQKQLKRLRG